ncbi:MAG: hypothetical protein AAGF66_02635 [Cyanobacteria bacterium P01_H01_bin.119]
MGDTSHDFAPAPPPVPESSSRVVYDKLVIVGEDDRPNLFDPSVEYDAMRNIGWLAYSDIEGDATPVGPYIHTNLARSLDNGVNWQLSTRANASFDDTLAVDGQEYVGVWRYEVPSLVHTPGASKPWKLFTHRYFSTPQEDRLFQFGWIAMSEAIDPAGPWTETEAFLGTKMTPFAPFMTRLRTDDIEGTDGALDDIVVFTEPGALFLDDILYLSLSGATAGGVELIFLIASEDFGQSWYYVGELISKADAVSLGAERYDASSLVKIEDEVFLLASPMRNGLLHDGTSVFRFRDITHGTLEQSSDGQLVESNHIPVQTQFTMGDRGGGQADYDQGNFPGGVLFPQLTIEDDPQFFQIFQTSQGIKP